MAQAIRDEVIEELLQGYTTPQDLLGEEGLFKPKFRSFDLNDFDHQWLASHLRF